MIRRSAQWLALALWLNAIPATLAAIVLRWLVPPARTGFPGLVSTMGHSFPVPFAAGLFLLFAVIARHWRYLLPEGSDASALPSPPLAAPGLAARRRRDTAVLGASVLLVAVAGLALRATILKPYQVASSSMLPTLAAGDRVLGRKVAYAAAGRLPAPGDIVAFRSAAVDVVRRKSLPSILMKRVVGLPGDHIEVSNGVPVLNGWTVPTCNVGTYTQMIPDGNGGLLEGVLTVEFLGEHAYLTVRAGGMPGLDGEYVVQPGEVFVLGDNRSNSVDSRSYGNGKGGGVPLPAIEARADRFLVGTDRSGEADFARVLRPMGRIEEQLDDDALSLRELRQGVAKCLEQRPSTTSPPAPAEPNAGNPGTPGPT